MDDMHWKTVHEKFELYPNYLKLEFYNLINYVALPISIKLILKKTLDCLWESHEYMNSINKRLILRGKLELFTISHFLDAQTLGPCSAYNT